jgi:N-formylglutamate amidohydrolase
MKFEFDYSQPLVAASIHGGHKLTKQLQRKINVTGQQRFAEEDPFMELLTKSFGNSIKVETSRFVADVNRRPHRFIYQRPEDAWGLAVLQQPLNSSELDQAANFYRKFYHKLEYYINRLLLKFPVLFVYDFHSFNARTENGYPDIIVGRSNLQSRFYPIAIKLQQHYQNGYNHSKQVILDGFYPGGNFPRWLHRTFPNRVICIAMEFNKNLFMTSPTGTLKEAEFNMLKQLVENSKPVILDYLDEIS